MFNPLANAFGLDIGDQSFKLAQLKQAHGSGKYKLTALGSIEVPPGIMEEGTIADPREAARLINRLIKSSTGHPKGRGVVACLPEAKTFIKLIDAPADLSAKSLEKSVLKEIEQNIPLSLGELYFDWQLLTPEDRTESDLTHVPDGRDDQSFETFAETEDDEPAQNEDDEEDEKEEDQIPVGNKIVIGAAPKKLVDQYSEMLDLAGLTPIAFEIEAMAICRAIVPNDNLLTHPIGILDIGATRSSLIIYDQDMIQMSISIPVAGTSITEMISKTLNLSLDDAETLKIECGLDANRCEDKIWSIVQPQIDDLTQKIKRALKYYKTSFPCGRDIEHLLVCGGGANFREIDTVLSRKMAIKVIRGDALINVKSPTNKKFAKRRRLTFSTALGLAMRAADESNKNARRIK
jgi:type IV pilus assembly protein PilM